MLMLLISFKKPTWSSFGFYTRGYDFWFVTHLLQETGVGKSSIVWRFVEDSFDPNINPTIG